MRGSLVGEMSSQSSLSSGDTESNLDSRFRAREAWLNFKERTAKCPHDWSQMMGWLYPEYGADEPDSLHVCLQCGASWTEKAGTFWLDNDWYSSGLAVSKGPQEAAS